MRTSPTPSPISEVAGPISVEMDPSGVQLSGALSGSRKSVHSQVDLAHLDFISSRDSKEDFNSTDKEDFSNSQLCIVDDEIDGVEGPLSTVSLQTMPPSTMSSNSGAMPMSPNKGFETQEKGVNFHGVPVGGLLGMNSGLKGDTALPRERGWLDGLLGCLRPVWTMIGKATTNEIKMQGKDNWEIAFEEISELQWLGSGAQGAVFQGRLNSELVAVKKVREEHETDIRHLRKLNHPNITTFKGVCIQAPCYCIVMEYCPYGPLYELLKKGAEIPPQRMVDWATQIANGMNYLHGHKIIHRDLKSPNVLIGNNEIVKISDFGTSRQWNEISTKMSFAGTVAWMAPEIIRNEPCSEKVDIWSFGVVLWELLTCETPYKDVDSTAIIWGVGSHSLHLPVPTTCPEGFKLLMKQCWSPKPRNRPSFRSILMHLDIAAVEILSFPKDTYFQTQASWRAEVRQHMQKIPSQGTHLPQIEEDLVKRRREELRHAQDVREHYEKKLDRANNLYLELSACLLQLEQREKEIMKREQTIVTSSNKCHRQRIVTPIIKAQAKLNKKRTQKHSVELTSFNAVSPESSNKGSPQIRSPTSDQHSCHHSPSYHPSSAKMRSRRSRHKKIGSQGGGSGNYSHLAEGSGAATPRTSPNRGRKSSMIDTETQTETMDISETDTSPHPVPKHPFHLPLIEPNFALKRENSIRKSSPRNSPVYEAASPSHIRTMLDEDRERRRNYHRKSKSNSGSPSCLTPDQISSPKLLRPDLEEELRKLSVDNNNLDELTIVESSIKDEHGDHSNGNVVIDQVTLSDNDTETIGDLVSTAERLITPGPVAVQVLIHHAGRKRSAGSDCHPDHLDDFGDGDFKRTSSLPVPTSVARRPTTLVAPACSSSVSSCTLATSTSGYRGSSCLGLDSEGDALDSHGQEDSWSEEEGEVDDSDDYVLRRKSRHIVLRLNRRSMQSNSTLSSEGNLSEEENTSEYSSRNTPSSRFSTLSNPDVMKNLERYGSLPSDNLSEKERQVEQVTQQAKLSAILDQFPSVTSSSSSSSSETEEISDNTVASVSNPSPEIKKNETTVW